MEGGEERLPADENVDVKMWLHNLIPEVEDTKEGETMDTGILDEEDVEVGEDVHLQEPAKDEEEPATFKPPTPPPPPPQTQMKVPLLGPQKYAS